MKIEPKSEEMMRNPGNIFERVANSLKPATVTSFKKHHKSRPGWKHMQERDIELINKLHAMNLNIGQISTITKRGWITVQLAVISKNLEHYHENQREYIKQRREKMAAKQKPSYESTIKPTQLKNGYPWGTTAEQESKIKTETVFATTDQIDPQVEKMIESNLRLEKMISILIEKVDRFLKVFES